MMQLTSPRAVQSKVEPHQVPVGSTLNGPHWSNRIRSSRAFGRRDNRADLEARGSAAATATASEPSVNLLVQEAVEVAAEVAYVSAKRLIDLVGSLAVIALLSPVMAVIALLVKLYDGGPVLYRHTRVGHRGREFSCYKFRSMSPNADAVKLTIQELNDHDDHRTFKMKNDPRVTPLGRLLRKASLDELPQLWNIIAGDMSLVGPRPPVPAEVAAYSPADMERLSVKPGLTCIWQVSGRSHIPFPEQLQMDLEYIENRSLLLDLKLIARTVPAVLSAHGAY